jgi:hypothetical protein
MKVGLFLVVVLLLCAPAFAQQDHVNRYIVFTGFSYMTTPELNLNQRGFTTSAGINMKRWWSLGAGFGVLTGSTGLVARDTKLGPVLAPFTPPGVTISVPFDATTYTFGVGPQLNLRKWKPITPFIRPEFGGFHESADLTIPPSVNQLLVARGLPPVASHQSEISYFYGVGAGFDPNPTRNVGLRFSVEWARTHLFSNFLNIQNNVRFSVGPTWKWGELKE